MSTSIQLSHSSEMTLTGAEVKAHVQAIQEVMKSVMKADVHYGIIPGTKKPTLYKPGSEILLSMFHIAVEPMVEDLSTKDEARYRVTCHARTMGTPSRFLGAGVGECSSDEEKYKWRGSICKEEFEETPEDRRREVWKRGKDKPYKVQQVRTNVADVANTILKMAKKRAQIDMTLTVTAASDCFEQDLDDMSPEMRAEIERADNEQKTAGLKQPQPKEAVDDKKPPEGQRFITDKQSKRLWAIFHNGKHGMTQEQFKEWLKANHGLDSSKHIVDGPMYESVCEFLEKGPQSS